jgi:hypothetical protein
VPTDAAVADEVATTRQVFDHHLDAFALGLDALVSDSTERSVIQLPDQTLRGLTAIRQWAGRRARRSLGRAADGWGLGTG